ncbi:MAG: hypothetical protein WC805_02380 [Patescibacteria group bacterium]|jgi:hypothetical protein
MPRIQNLIAAFLVLGLIYAELLPTLKTANSAAYSENALEPTQSELLLSFFDPANKKEAIITAPADEIVFISDISTIPDKLISFSKDARSAVYTVATTPLPTTPDNTNPSAVIVSPTIPTIDQPFIGDVIPKSGTPLSEAYATGGRAWYELNDNVVVIFADSETFRSYKKSTGEETDWLQTSLSYAPLDSPDALTNYINNYHGEIVAETKTWVLMSFPSGGYLKIAKPVSVKRPFLSQQ